jgi:hypothetical protein
MRSRKIQFRLPEDVHKWLGGPEDENMAAKQIVMEAYRNRKKPSKTAPWNGREVEQSSVESKLARALRALGSED